MQPANLQDALKWSAKEKVKNFINWRRRKCLRWLDPAAMIFSCFSVLLCMFESVCSVVASYSPFVFYNKEFWRFWPYYVHSLVKDKIVYQVLGKCLISFFKNIMHELSIIKVYSVHQSIATNMKWNGTIK